MNTKSLRKEAPSQTFPGRPGVRRLRTKTPMSCLMPEHPVGEFHKSRRRQGKEAWASPGQHSRPVQHERWHQSSYPKATKYKANSANPNTVLTLLWSSNTLSNLPGVIKLSLGPYFPRGSVYERLSRSQMYHFSQVGSSTTSTCQPSGWPAGRWQALTAGPVPPNCLPASSSGCFLAFRFKGHSSKWSSPSPHPHPLSIIPVGHWLFFPSQYLLRPVNIFIFFL